MSVAGVADSRAAGRTPGPHAVGDARIRPPRSVVAGAPQVLFTLVIAAAVCALVGCRGASQTAVPVDEHVRSLLSSDIREKLPGARIPVLLPATLARKQIGSMVVADGAYEWSAESGDVRIRVRGDPLDADREARVALLGSVEMHPVRGRRVMVAGVPGGRRGRPSYSARWVEGNALYSVDVSCVQAHVTCETNAFILQVLEDLAVVWGGRG